MADPCRVRRGELPAPEEDAYADRYELIADTLADAGYGWYEISNWARTPADRCRHNEAYWRSHDWWGVGPGASREKWSWLPEAHNDFIFAIIGEELGLIGTLTILALFAAFAVAGLRLVTRTDDFFVRIAASGVMVWILVQAIVNIGAVIGALPIIGVPLPFVSYGGSSVIASGITLGMLLALTRTRPQNALADVLGRAGR